MLGRITFVQAAMVLTASKLVSIIISAVFVNAPPFPGASLWVGCAAVVGGNFLYRLAPERAPRSSGRAQTQKAGAADSKSPTKGKTRKDQ